MNLEHLQKALGENVRNLRRERGLTQDAMRGFGFNYRYYQKIEAGAVNATLDTLVKLANVFKRRPSELLE